MKRTQIIMILVIAAAIGLLTIAAGDMATYGSFADTTQQQEGVKVVGALIKDRPIEYDALTDANSFSFWMRDKKGNESKVRLLVAKPQEFERSEELVLTGKMQNGEFVATDLLMKCPSKYKDEEVYVKSQERG